MKIKVLLILIKLIAFASCFTSNEFEIPELEIEGIHMDPNKLITIGALQNLLIQEINNNGNDILSFDDQNPDNDKYISGYVISNDEAGNYYKELIIQNDTIYPNAGVKVLIDVSPLYTSFEVGRKLYIKLDGLAVGIDQGVLSLGMRDGNSVSHIASSVLNEFVLRDSKVAGIRPLDLDISGLGESFTNLFISIDNVQFHRYEVSIENPKTFAAEPTDQYSGERTLESCIDRSQIKLSTSSFADFKAMLLPSGRGVINAILSYDFFGEKFNLVINSPLDINFDNSDRCDPLEIACGISAMEGHLLVFSEFFETQQPGTPINGFGWTNYIEEGSQYWEAYVEEGANASLGISARVGSYNSGDESSICWLISPLINFQSYDGETLKFKTSNSFSDGSMLEIMFSQDWDGNPETITISSWALLSDAYIVNDDDYFGDWVTSGVIDLSCITGDGYIAWRYVGSGNPAYDGTYELDNIELYTDL